MPNYVMNELRADPDVLHALLTEAGVEFNRLIPQPADILLDPCSHGYTAEREHRCPPNCWNVWNSRHWGTKWNAMRTSMPTPDRLRFETAWHHPVPIIRALGDRFPHDLIRVRYADEETGYNLGEYEVRGPAELETVIDEGTSQARKLAKKIWKDPAA